MPGSGFPQLSPEYFAFWGTINELSIYSGALTPNEIQAIYAAGGYGKCPDAPMILSQPTNDIVNGGGTATLAVIAIASTPLTYQWALNQTNILQGTNSELILTN